MTQKSVAFVIISILLALSGCDPTVKRYLGIERKAPDEYSVVKSSPLSVPPNFDLTPPDQATKQSTDTINRSSNSSEPLTENDKLFLKKAQKKSVTKLRSKKIDHSKK